MSNCLNCERDITSKGKREKKFCSDLCRASFHQKNKPKKEKPIKTESPGIVVDNSPVLAEMDKVFADKIPEHRNTHYGKQAWLNEKISRLQTLRLQLK